MRAGSSSAGTWTSIDSCLPPELDRPAGFRTELQNGEAVGIEYALDWQTGDARPTAIGLLHSVRKATLQ